jgi:hypothetical protein
MRVFNYTACGHYTGTIRLLLWICSGIFSGYIATIQYYLLSAILAVHWWFCLKVVQSVEEMFLRRDLA